MPRSISQMRSDLPYWVSIFRKNSASVVLSLARLPQLDLDFTQFTAFSARKCLIEHNRDT
jgi:hypothetical protein